jgi:hypothetical protein
VTDYPSWSETVASSPMPIIMNVVPYVWLVEDETKRDSLTNALVDYMLGSLTADNTLATGCRNVVGPVFTYDDYEDYDLAWGFSPPVEVGDEWILPLGTSPSYGACVQELSPSNLVSAVQQYGGLPLLQHPSSLATIWGGIAGYNIVVMIFLPFE